MIVVFGLVGLAVMFAIGVALFLAFSRKPGGGGGGGFGAGASFPPGTRAFESEMAMSIIVTMIEARETQLRGQVDDDKRALLTQQIANLRRQAELHREVIANRDVSKGKMSIGVNPDSDTI